MKDMVKISDLYQTFYTKDGELEVLKNINFNLIEGEILTLLGPSGSGKSTILNILTNLLKPTSGQVIINGKVGYMFQKDNLLEWLNILDNILIGLRIQKKLTKESKEKALKLLEKYGLIEFIDAYPSELSGGMRQRVALIRALMLNPSLLLLDEAFSALDAQTRIKVSSDVYKIIKDLKMTTIMVTHDITEAISFADNILILTDRPATLKLDIELEFNNLNPNERRSHPLFNKYFDLIWGEINDTRT